jgi:hypothetical protein
MWLLLDGAEKQVCIAREIIRTVEINKEKILIEMQHDTWEFPKTKLNVSNLERFINTEQKRRYTHKNTHEEFIPHLDATTIEFL